MGAGRQKGLEGNAGRWGCLGFSRPPAAAPTCPAVGAAVPFPRLQMGTSLFPRSVVLKIKMVSKSLGALGACIPHPLEVLERLTEARLGMCI